MSLFRHCYKIFAALWSGQMVEENVTLQGFREGCGVWEGTMTLRRRDGEKR